MSEIRHRIGIAAPKERVYEALATVDGLSSWWSHTEGDPAVGGRLKIFFGQSEPAATMEVVALNPAKHVGWSCVAGIDEWGAAPAVAVFRPVPHDDVNDARKEPACGHNCRR